MHLYQTAGDLCGGVRVGVWGGRVRICTRLAAGDLCEGERTGGCGGRVRICTGLYSTAGLGDLCEGVKIGGYGIRVCVAKCGSERVGP